MIAGDQVGRRKNGDVSHNSVALLCGALLVVCSGCVFDSWQTKYLEGNDFVNSDKEINPDLVAVILERFIIDHNDELALEGMSVSVDSVKGTRSKESDKLWFIGDWAVQGVAPRFFALFSQELAPGETMRLFVHLEQTGNSYTVSDWEIEETFDE